MSLSNEEKTYERALVEKWMSFHFKVVAGILLVGGGAMALEAISRDAIKHDVIPALCRHSDKSDSAAARFVNRALKCDAP